MDELLVAIVTNEGFMVHVGAGGAMGQGAVIESEICPFSPSWSGLLGFENDALDLATHGGAPGSAHETTVAVHTRLGTETRALVSRRGSRVFLRLVAYAPAKAFRTRVRGRHPRRERRQRNLARAGSMTGDPPPPSRRHAPLDLLERGWP
jgi:hypothetical protein